MGGLRSPAAEGKAPHWLGLADRDDTSRYRSVRLLRQRAWGDCAGAFDRAATALMQHGRGR